MKGVAKLAHEGASRLNLFIQRRVLWREHQAFGCFGHENGLTFFKPQLRQSFFRKDDANRVVNLCEFEGVHSRLQKYAVVITVVIFARKS